MKSSDNSARTFQKKKLLAFSTLKNDLLLLYTQKHTETNPSNTTNDSVQAAITDSASSRTKHKRWRRNYIIKLYPIRNTYN